MVFLEILVLYIHSYLPFLFCANGILFHYFKFGLEELLKVANLFVFICVSVFQHFLLFFFGFFRGIVGYLLKGEITYMKNG